MLTSAPSIQPTILHNVAAASCPWGFCFAGMLAVLRPDRMAAFGVNVCTAHTARLSGVLLRPHAGLTARLRASSTAATSDRRLGAVVVVWAWLSSICLPCWQRKVIIASHSVLSTRLDWLGTQRRVTGTVIRGTVRSVRMTGELCCERQVGPASVTCRPARANSVVCRG
jgi:hypothetical protein